MAPPEIKNLHAVAETTAKFMDSLERELADVEAPEIVHVGVIAEVRHGDGDEFESYVILETDEDSRIMQIGIFTAGVHAATWGYALEEGDE